MNINKQFLKRPTPEHMLLLWVWNIILMNACVNQAVDYRELTTY